MDWSERLITYETDSKMPPGALAEVFCSDTDTSINHSPCAGTPSPGSSAPGTGFKQGNPGGRPRVGSIPAERRAIAQLSPRLSSPVNPSFRRALGLGQRVPQGGSLADLGHILPQRRGDRGEGVCAKRV